MISRSTGKGKKSKPVDIAILQLLFNQICLYAITDPKTKVTTHRLEVAADGTPLPDEAESLPNLKVDGSSTTDLIKRVEAYQQAIGMSKPDGWVGANGKTIKELMKKANVAVGTNRMTFIRKAVGHGRTVSMIKPLTVVNLYKQQYYEESYNFSSANMAGLEFILTKAKADSDLSFIPEFAYMLATAKYETYHSFLPVDEKKKGAGRDYGKEITVTYTDKKKKITTYKNVYFGRGYVQLTWGTNYQVFDQMLGNGKYPNLVGATLTGDKKWNKGFTISNPTQSIYLHPAKVKEKHLAYKIMVEGMQKGTFTQKHKIGTFVNKSKIDYIGARRVINKQDKVKLFAGYAENFEVLLLISTGS